jgi:hypothetical protein
MTFPSNWISSSFSMLLRLPSARPAAHLFALAGGEGFDPRQSAGGIAPALLAAPDTLSGPLTHGKRRLSALARSPKQKQQRRGR